MSQKNPIIPPPVKWAQSHGQIYLTFCLEDCKNPTVKIEPDKIYFKGVGGKEQKEYEVTIHFYEEIDPGCSIQNGKGRLYEVVLSKQEFGPYWPKLTKEDQKLHWLKCDFNKFKDEDDSESDSERVPELHEKLVKMGNCMNYKGNSKPDFVDFGEDENDSDNETLPELE